MKNKSKVGIISELTNENVNYGNRLQSYALNRFINNKFRVAKVDSLIFRDFKRRVIYKYTKKDFSLIYKFIDKIKPKIINRGYDPKHTVAEAVIKERLKAFKRFIETHKDFSVKIVSYNEFIDSDYDIFLVGSDVVWAQMPGKVNKIKFLNFKTKKNFKKIAYAPSFSRNYFPSENRSYIKRCLEDFDAISVRDRFSQRLLREIGINSKLVCDPTLLLSKTEWSKVAKKPEINEKYIFVYLLGINSQCRKEIEKLATKLNLKIATIPCADENLGNDIDFGDYKFPTCAPEEWIWLIQNAEYVFTDSFHGTIFSTIFEKKFLVIDKIERGKSAAYHPPDRIIDFLETIDGKDKYRPVPNLEELQKLDWDYVKINKKIKTLQSASINFLKDNLL